MKHKLPPLPQMGGIWTPYWQGVVHRLIAAYAEQAVNPLQKQIAELKAQLASNNKIEQRRDAMKIEHWATETLRGATGTFQRAARGYAEDYADQVAKPLQKRIAELEGMIHTCSAGCTKAGCINLVLKHRVAELEAQLASGHK